MNEEKILPSGFTTPETPSGTPQLSGSGLPQMAKEAAQTAKTKIETLKSAAQEQGGAAVEEIKTVAQSATRQAQEAGRDFIDEQKENLAQRVDQYTEAMRSACEKLRNEEGNVLAGPAQKAVDQLERMSGYLREKPLADVLDDLESYARRRPEVVFGGLFVVGLAAARFFKASRRRPRRAGPPEAIGNASTPGFSAAALSSVPSAALSFAPSGPSSSPPSEASTSSMP
jgi:gas vesicle protein